MGDNEERRARGVRVELDVDRRPQPRRLRGRLQRPRWAPVRRARQRHRGLSTSRCGCSASGPPADEVVVPDAHLHRVRQPGVWLGAKVTFSTPTAPLGTSTPPGSRTPSAAPPSEQAPKLVEVVHLYASRPTWTRSDTCGRYGGRGARGRRRGRRHHLQGQPRGTMAPWARTRSTATRSSPRRAAAGCSSPTISGDGRARFCRRQARTRRRLRRRRDNYRLQQRGGASARGQPGDARPAWRGAAKCLRVLRRSLPTSTGSPSHARGRHGLHLLFSVFLVDRRASASL